MAERKMFFNAPPHLFDKAKRLRENMTEAEKLLWEQIVYVTASNLSIPSLELNRKLTFLF